MKSSNSAHQPEELIRLGKIVGAHGIRGALKIYSYAESVESFTLQRSLIVQQADGSRQPYELVSCQAHKQVVRAVLREVTTRNQAEALTGCDVYVSRASLPQLEAGTYYWNDLIGMSVATETGDHLGRICQIIPTGANDVYVVQSAHGSPAEILIPAIPSVVIEIDVERKIMIVTLPEGLI